MIRYNKILRDLIKDEKRGIDYNYTKKDKIIFTKMLDEIYELTRCRFRYLAELDFYDIPNIGPIIAKYISAYESEDMKGYLIPQVVADQVKDCDLLILDLYKNFRCTDNNIIESSSHHIYARYDNAFKSMKSKRIKNDLLEIISCPIDAYNLPFTTELLAKWKLPEMKNILIRYLEPSQVLYKEVGLTDLELCEHEKILNHIKRELQFRAIDGLKYYPDKDVYDKLKPFLTANDIDIKIAAKKSVQKIEKVLNK